MKFPIVLRKNGATVKIYCGATGPMSNLRYYYTICWKGANGRERECRSALPAARTRAYEIINDLCAGRADRIKISAVLLSYWHSCAEKLGKVPMMEAVDFYLDKHKPHTPPVASDVVQLFLKEKEIQGVSNRHLATLRHHLNHWLKLGGGSWMAGETYLKWIPCLRTRRNHRITLITFGKWLVSSGWFPESPFEKTTNPIVPPTDPGILTPKELRAVLAQADDCTKKFIVLGAFAGLRASEILRVKWLDCDWSNNLIILGRGITKTKRRRTIHIQPSLRTWLEALAPMGAEAKELIVDCPNPHLGLRKAVKAAGVTWSHNCLRHSYISYRMALTQNAAAVAEECGNSESVLQEAYKNNTTSQTANDWFTITP